MRRWGAGASISGMTRHIVIGGGGIGALEGVLALQAHAPELRISVVAPSRHVPYPALSAAEPFGGAPPPRPDWEAIARDRRIRWIPDAVTGVRPVERQVVTRDGPPVPYDALLLALGARPVDALPGALTFAGPRDVIAVREALDALPAGATVAFVVPSGVAWALPLYELALLTGARYEHAITIVTPERAPLEAFGAAAAAEVERRLARAGITLRLGAAGEEPAAADLVVALPRLVGPALPGLPHDAGGFVPVDAFCRVRGVDAVWAVGDMTARRLKQGGLAAQQADVAAAAIAAPATAVPYRPALRGLLLTGAEPLFLERRPGAPSRSEASDRFLWWPADKVAGHHLGRYLASLSG
jgi:sulfide:quinone oxidoreductase